MEVRTKQHEVINTNVITNLPGKTGAEINLD